MLLGKYLVNLASHKHNSSKYLESIYVFFSLFITLIYLSNIVKELGTVRLKFNAMIIFDSISKISCLVYVLSVTSANFLSSGG